MKEATGEGSMTVVTIVVIVALLGLASLVVFMLVGKVNNNAEQIDGNQSNNVNCTKNAQGKWTCQ